MGYQVQYTTNLASTNWTNLGAAIIATNSVTIDSDNLGPDPQRFYRSRNLLQWEVLCCHSDSGRTRNSCRGIPGCFDRWRRKMVEHGVHVFAPGLKASRNHKPFGSAKLN